MQCPYCQYTDSRVLESRSTEAGQSIRRRRECLRCKHRFTTYERLEFVPVTVIKQDSRREYFDRSKLLRGIIHACQKTGLTPDTLESIVDDIESQLQGRTLREVTTAEIGELVLLELRPLSEVAYIRFASVYRQFQGIRDFVDTLHQLSEVRSQDRSPEDVVSVGDSLESGHPTMPLGTASALAEESEDLTLELSPASAPMPLDS
jgi:transcriptional repressor NrdR